jgi:hypothetical protein
MNDEPLEDCARAMLERAGVPDVHDYSAGDLVEIANMLDELARLRADLATATEAGNVLTAKLASLRADLRTLSGALETERADAQRFRWMRDNPASIPYRDEMDVWCVPYLVSNAGGHGGGVGESRHKSLDAAIDAAIKSGLK